MQILLALVLFMTASILPARAGQLDIVVLGDSLSSGYGLDPTEGFTPTLEKALRDEGLDIRIVNAGVAGNATAVLKAPSSAGNWAVTATVSGNGCEPKVTKAMIKVAPAMSRG